jgi:anti-anti-sigma factor
MQMLQEIQTQQPEAVVLDMGGLELIDSTGLGLLIRASDQFQQVRTSLRLRDAPPAIMRLLRLTSLDKRLTLDGAETPIAEPPTPVERQLLVVDDEAMVLNFTAAYLQRSGYHAFTAETPDAALEILREHGDIIDLVIVDLSLPGMSGFELMRRMREIRPAMRFLVSSGLSETDLAEAAAIEGVLGVLQKPYRADHLLQTVREAIDV